jgi:putative flippase GtrA
VQLTSLALLVRCVTAHYLLASIAALEITLLHNFAWHERFTWRDRQEENARVRRLLRFHVTNGLVSLTGSLLLMPLLVEALRMQAVSANALVILCCSMVNFCLGDGWAFAGVRKSDGRRLLF